MKENNSLKINTNKKRRSIRDIPITYKGNRPSQELGSNFHEKKSDINLKNNTDLLNKKTERNEDVENEDRDTYCEDNYHMETKLRRRRKFPFIILGLVIVLILVVSLMNIFSSVKVNLILKSAEVSSSSLVINLADDASITSNNILEYKNLTIESTSNISVEANKEELVKQKASGIITVYNTYSGNDQNWIRNTRFEAPNGLIYRSPDGITIPGFKTINEKVVPGEISIEVFADEIGENYNLPSGTNFTVPAFKGQDSYDSFYAVSKTNIEGGFDGVRKIVTESDLASARNSLEDSLKQDLISKLSDQIPNNMIVLYDESFFQFSQITQSDSNDNLTTLNQKATLNTIIIEKDDLAKIIANKNLADYRHGEDVTIENIDDIEIRLIVDENNYSIEISGSAKIVWQINKEKLANDLAGKSSTDIKDVLVDYRSINSVTTEFSPIWSKTFPDNIKRINIIRK